MKTIENLEVRERLNEWQPNIRLFYCQCAGGGAALRMDPPEEFRSEIVPCTGKIDVQRLLKAFEGGADAIFIIGCPPGECKMAEGNLRAGKRALQTRRILEEIGLDGDRIEVLMPEANAESLQGAVDSIKERVKNLGPSALNLVDMV